MGNSLIIKTYLIYLPIALGLTAYVSHMLFKNSKVFMMDIFNGRKEIALSTNQLFKIGFYLWNMGFAFLIMKINVSAQYYTSHQDLIETLSKKLGGFSIYLGVMLFANLYLFFRGKSKARAMKSV